MPVLPAANSTPFSTVLSRLVSRVTTELTRGTPPELIDPAYVRVTAAPDDDAGYRAEEGLTIRVTPPQPFPDDGAGRYGLRVRRGLTVQVVTQCLLDKAGEDVIALARHFDLEEAVVNCLHDAPPNDVKTGVRVKWQPGAAEADRPYRIDAGLIRSTLTFDVIYVNPFVVTRD